MFVPEYPKIPGPWKRYTEGPQRNKLIPYVWATDELNVLKEAPWRWTEKVDGTNVRIVWDGHKPDYRGRTDRAQLHPDLVADLEEVFTEELFEQAFGENEVILYGEGYGAGIQKGGVYREDKSFILFDVKIGSFWLRYPDVKDVAQSFGVATVPLVGDGLTVLDAIERIRNGVRSLLRHDGGYLEGVVGTTDPQLFDRTGHRIIVKVKTCDFFDFQGVGQ